MRKSLADAQNIVLSNFSRDCRSTVTGGSAVEIALKRGSKNPLSFTEVGAPQFSNALEFLKR